MKVLEINGHRIELHDDIEQMNVMRYHKFSKLCAMEAGIGSDMTAVIGKIGTIIRHIENNKPKNAIAELKNMALAMDFTQRMFNPHSMAFSALVCTIDGREYNDLSDEGLKRVSDEIGAIFTKAGLDKEVAEVKKKSLTH